MNSLDSIDSLVIAAVRYVALPDITENTFHNSSIAVNVTGVVAIA
jgi:hypothetical protein